jgi:type I restriction enzyme S subunit
LTINRRLDEIAQLQVGFAFKSAGFSSGDEDVRLLRGDNIGQGVLRWENAVRWSADDAVDERYAMQSGDLVIAMDRPWIGAGLKFASVTERDLPAWLVQRVARLRALPGVDQRYLHYLIASRDFTSHILAVQTGTAIPHVSGPQILSFGCPDHSLLEQRAIAEVLGALDDKIASNGRLTRAIDELLSSHFARLGVDEEPEGIGAPITHYVHVNPAVPMPRGAEAIYLDMKSVPEAGPAVVAWSCRPPRGGARFRNGDTVMARITPCLENGKTGYVDFMDEGEVGVGSTEFIVLRSRDHVPMPLSYFLARSPRFREFAIRHMVGSSGRQRLSGGDLRGLQVRVVPQGDLDAFGALAGPLMSRLKAATDESRALVSLRDSLLPVLMSGKIRVKDAEKVVEGVV